MNIQQKMEKIKELEAVNTPWKFSRIFGKVGLFGAQVHVGVNGDFVSLEELKEAIEWLVSELDGKVKWSKNDKNS